MDINRERRGLFLITWFILLFQRICLTACFLSYFLKFLKGCGDSWLGLGGDIVIRDIRIASIISHGKCLNCGHRDMALGISHLIPQEKIGRKWLSHRDVELNSQENRKHMLQGILLKTTHLSRAKYYLQNTVLSTPSWNKKYRMNIFRSVNSMFYIFPSLWIPWLLMWRAP